MSTMTMPNISATHNGIPLLNSQAELHRTRRTLAAFKIAFLLGRRGGRPDRGGCVRRATQAAEGLGVALVFFRYSYNIIQRKHRAGKVCMPPALRVCALDLKKKK